MRKRDLKNVEWWILIIAIILTLIGLVALFSATQNTGYDEFKKQIIWFAVSIVLMLASFLWRFYYTVGCGSFYNSNKWCN